MMSNFDLLLDDQNIIQKEPTALSECIVTFYDYKRWAILGWMDVRLRYRRTVLGPWWATFSIGAMIGSVGLVFGSIFGDHMADYLPFFASGIIVWTFISSALLEGCNVFIQSSGLIKSVTLPLVLHIYRMLWRLLVVLAHNAVIIVVVWLIFRWSIDWRISLALPGLALVSIALFGAALTLGVLCTRFRDVPQIIQAVIQILFLLAPIVWKPTSERAAHLGVLLYCNPFYYLIEVVRGPLIGQLPGPYIWLGAVISATASIMMGLVFYGKFRHRVPFWL
jgi:ABC-type polysaccharide/polyol phosphate export permease